MSNPEVAFFDDPLDPARSLQLNNRYWAGETFENLDVLRQADDDINHGRWLSLRRTLKPVKALLPTKFHRCFLSRLIYSIVFHVQFQPIHFSIKLSDTFLRANAYSGTDTVASMSAKQTEELKYIVEMAHTIYRHHYGMDVLKSDFSVRYANASNEQFTKRMHAHGDFSDYHLDEKKDFTAIIYLGPVTRDNGCFTYVDSSPLMRRSHLLRALHQVVDFDMGLSGAPPEARSRLPLELRGSMRIGDYLDDAKRDRLRKDCVEVTGNAGDGVIFNGFDTIHRGGKPLTGERTAMFIGTHGLLNRRLKKAAIDQVAYLWL